MITTVNQTKTSAVVLFDMTKAFDSVNLKYTRSKCPWKTNLFIANPKTRAVTIPISEVCLHKVSSYNVRYVTI